MAPSVSDTPASVSAPVAPATGKGLEKAPYNANYSFNPFYSNIPSDDPRDANYEFLQYKPTWPAVDWEPLKEFSVTDVALRADKQKKALLGAASKVDTITPAIGTRLEGIDLRKLTDAQKDEL